MHDLTEHNRFKQAKLFLTEKSPFVQIYFPMLDIVAMQTLV